MTLLMNSPGFQLGPNIKGKYDRRLIHIQFQWPPCCCNMEFILLEFLFVSNSWLSCHIYRSVFPVSPYLSLLSLSLYAEPVLDSPHALPASLSFTASLWYREEYRSSEGNCTPVALSLFLSPPSPGESKEISSLCGPVLNRFDTQSEEVRGGCRDAHPREVTQRATQRASDEKSSWLWNPQDIPF